MNDSGLRFTSVTDMLRHLEIDEESIQDVEKGIAKHRDEHSQVGALLARCGSYEVGEYESGWYAEVILLGGGGGSSEVPYETQLGAIRAAVEAAEKGVRE